jgi:hypothetical protein
MPVAMVGIVLKEEGRHDAVPPYTDPCKVSDTCTWSSASTNDVDAEKHRKACRSLLKFKKAL